MELLFCNICYEISQNRGRSRQACAQGIGTPLSRRGYPPRVEDGRAFVQVLLTENLKIIDSCAIVVAARDV